MYVMHVVDETESAVFNYIEINAAHVENSLQYNVM